MFEYNGIMFIGYRNWTKKELKSDFSECNNRLRRINLVNNYNYNEFYKVAKAANEVFDIYKIEEDNIKIVPASNNFTYMIKKNGAADLIID